MDATRFDRLARALSGTAPRRGLTRLVAGAALAGIASPLSSLHGALAKKKKNKKKCKKGKKKCGKKCIPKSKCCKNANCGQGRICVKGACLTVQGTCEDGADFCLSGSSPCDGAANCHCLQAAGDLTRCGLLEGGATCGCTTNAQCEELLGVPGAICMLNTGGACTLACSGSNFCVPPCPV